MQGIANRTKIHQNKYAFAHNPNSKKSARIMAIPNVGLCQRCHDIIEWRKKFRKYKPIKNLTKCACCGEKKVRSAYHNWCTDCAKASNVCPKCLLNRELVEAEVAALTQDSIQDMLVQVGMKERVRRKIWRLWENNKVTDAELKQLIFNYNPDAKEEEDEDEEDDQAAAAAPAAARARPVQATASSSTSAAGAASRAQPTSDDEDALSGDEFDDDDEEDEDQAAAAAAAERARQLAAKRGPPPKPKAAAPKPSGTSTPTGSAPIATGLETSMANATLAPIAASPP